MRGRFWSVIVPVALAMIATAGLARGAQDTPPADEPGSAVEDRLRELLRDRLEGLLRNALEEPPEAMTAEERAKADARMSEAAARVEQIIEELGPIEPNPPFEIPEPPPHEGALIDYPVTIDPPDLIVVEVLEALPGRPITGERLVRPDGTISLGFYGHVHVRGLTPAQAKARIVLHLRRILDDEILGLIAFDEDGAPTAVAPGDSRRVFVDITSYNSKTYYVQGDVPAPGRFPSTGDDTVLSALNYAGGLAPTADPRRITLVRPARGAAPARVYPIDLDAILEHGDPKANLQLFPGDRLIVGRRAAEPAEPADGAAKPDPADDEPR